MDKYIKNTLVAGTSILALYLCANIYGCALTKSIYDFSTDQQKQELNQFFDNSGLVSKLLIPGPLIALDYSIDSDN